MKVLLLILILQSPQWIQIKEMSGPVPDHPGITVEFYAREIKRSNDRVRLLVRADFPGGAPVNLFKGNAPSGFDISSISRFEGRVELDCRSLTVKPMSGSADLYQFNGKKHKSKEPPFNIQDGHIFEKYFCERGSAPTVAPTLKKPL